MRKKIILIILITVLSALLGGVSLGVFLTIQSRTALLFVVLCVILAGGASVFLYRQFQTAHSHVSLLLRFLKDFVEAQKQELSRIFPEMPKGSTAAELSTILQRMSEKLQSLDPASLDTSFKDLATEWSILQNALLQAREKLFLKTEKNGAKETQSEELAAVLEQLRSLCSIHLPIDITSDWSSRIEKSWDSLSTETLESLSHIKDMQDSSSRFIEEMVKQFQIQQDSHKTYAETYQNSLKQYFDRVEGICSYYIRDLDSTTVQISNTFSLFNQIADIVERIKLISLNMSIEASKVKGTGAFSLLARELRRLAEHTEESIKNITQRIEGTLREVEASKEKQIHEFGDMMGIIEHFKEISLQYDETTATLTQYIQKAITQIEDNQQQEKTILMQFFKNMQDIAIQKEELNHIILYQHSFLRRANEIVQHFVRDTQICRGEACPDREEALKQLAALITTNTERIFLKELYRSLLGRELEESREPMHATDEGIVLF
ncbi:MAG TPA: hypothetical protein PLG79_08080 [Spirochaetales bacterium]|nr:hypothetical protein [Spirochaetales bacterium]